MIKFNNKNIDLLFQVEQNVPFNNILNNLNLDINTVMIVCPEMFFHNIISDLYNHISDEEIYSIENSLKLGNYNLEIKIKYKNKDFDFIFLMIPSESKIIDVPLKGEVKFDIGFKMNEFI